MKVTIEGNELVIRLPIQNPPVLSSTGKTLMVATTSGNKKTEATIRHNGQDKPVTIGVNAYIYPDK